MKYLFLICLAFTGCGKPPSIDLTFQPYVDQFNIEASKYGYYNLTKDVSIEFGDTTEHAGICHTGSSLIDINATFWSHFNVVQKEILIFHELGHCAFGKNHNEQKDSFGNPVSIMYPIMLAANVYTNNRVNYINELFN